MDAWTLQVSESDHHARLGGARTPQADQLFNRVHARLKFRNASADGVADMGREERTDQAATGPSGEESSPTITLTDEIHSPDENDLTPDTSRALTPPPYDSQVESLQVCNLADSLGEIRTRAPSERRTRNPSAPARRR